MNKKYVAPIVEVTLVNAESDLLETSFPIREETVDSGLTKSDNGTWGDIWGGAD